MNRLNILFAKSHEFGEVAKPISQITLETNFVDLFGECTFFKSRLTGHRSNT